jgi:predicted ATPase/serine/threonine protein kinase/Tfp pilus assembly protein PilF
LTEQLGRYELIEQIGSGGMADVFLARLVGVQGFERKLVVKRMRKEIQSHPEAVRMFLDEARLCAKLHHPHIVQVFDLGEADGDYFLAMEYVDGPHLGRLARDCWRAGTPPPLVLGAYVVHRAADGLHFAHETADPETGEPLGIVHRDVTPHNILVSRFGDVKVADFGVAKALGQTTNTRSGVIKGKLAYLSPEQVRGEDLDRRSDVFSLGIVLFETVTGRRLFKDKSDIVTLQRITKENAPPPSKLNDEIDGELDRIVLKALARDADKRYQTMREFERALGQWIAARETRHLKTALAQFIFHHGNLSAPRSREAPASRETPAAISDDDELEETQIDADADGPVSMPSQTEVVAASEEELTELDAEAVPNSAAGTNSLSTRAFDRLKTNLSPPRSRFIGRARDLDEIARLFDEGAQLLTIHGPAGTGKTRLAVRYAERSLRQLSEQGGGAWLVDLTDARSIDGICAALAQALGVPLTHGPTEDNVEVLAKVLAGRGRTLFIFDTFEQVVDLGPQTVGRWLADAPDARFLVTSRELLRLPGEQTWELGPMSVPDADADADVDVREAEAVQLFVDRARSADPGFVLGDADAPIVADIVRHLDGIPLAIELAAARITVLKPRQLREKLSRRFDVLRGGSRDAAPRQATLKSALDWSWDLLDPVEQDAFAQCSVFRGGFDLEAAEAVLDLSSHEGAPWVLDVLQALRDKSLLRAYDAPGFSDEARFGMYESVREYAAEKLDRSGARGETEERHAEHYLPRAEGWSRDVHSRLGEAALRRLKLEAQNLVAIHGRTLRPRPSWASPDEPLRVAVALEPLFDARGPRREQIQLLDDALESAAKSGNPVLRARAFAARGRARRRLGEIAASRSDFGDALRLTRAADDEGEEARVLRDLGLLASDEGRLDDAQRNYDDALALHRKVGDRREEAATLAFLAFHHDEQGQLEEATEHYEKCLAGLREAGDRQLEALVLGNYASLEQELGNLDGAQRHYERALTILEEMGQPTFIGPFLGSLATLHHEAARFDEAVETFERALVSMRETGNLRYEGLMCGYLAAVQTERGELDGARELLERADRIHQDLGDPRQAFCGQLQRAFVDVAEARRALDAGDETTAGERLDRVKARMGDADRVEEGEGGRSMADSSDEVRRTIRLLQGALERAGLADRL